MKKIFIVLVFFVFMIILTSCSKEEAIPMENPQIELFQVIFESDEYSIFKRTDIDSDMSFTLEAYGIGTDDDSCLVGSRDKYMYRFLYKESYYNIVEANKLNLFTCAELTEIGIIGE